MWCGVKRVVKFLFPTVNGVYTYLMARMAIITRIIIEVMCHIILELIHTTTTFDRNREQSIISSQLRLISLGWNCKLMCFVVGRDEDIKLMFVESSLWLERASDRVSE